jgi:F-type H+-transporting ATPase subunit alpha
MPVERQIIEIFAAVNGYLDEYPVAALPRYLSELHLFIESKHPVILKDIQTKKKLDDELTGKVKKALEEMKVAFQA